MGLRPLPPTPADFRIFGFFDFSENVNFEIFQWDFGSGRVCNGWEMAVGFKWTDSQPISMYVGPFLTCSLFGRFLIRFRGSRAPSGRSQDPVKCPEAAWKGSETA